MVRRYTRNRMGEIWSEQNRFAKLLEVEIAVAEVQAEFGIIPKEAAQAIRSKATFQIGRIDEIEKTTKHDIIAFVSNVAENVGEHGKYIHFGLTSSDALDTALSLQVKEAGHELLSTIKQLDAALKSQVAASKDMICAGRTHGMHAEPTTLGFKLGGFWVELHRHKHRLEKALEQMAICKLSGAVGTYSSLDPKVEKAVAKKLGLFVETVATQVIPRDRHAEVMVALALFGAGLERLAVELRHLQRTEVGEVIEGFDPGQKGSSAMPHKKNPISAENITGLSRLLRGYAVSALENVALWHERDISHSSVERVIFPDAFIVADYAADRMRTLVSRLDFQVERMRQNMDLSQGNLFSSQILLALVETGLSREAAYAQVQKLAHGLKPNDTLRSAIAAEPAVSSRLSKDTIDEIFSGRKHLRVINQHLEEIGALK